MQTNQSTLDLFSSDSPFVFIAKAREGLLKQEADWAGQSFAISDREMARILSISERSYHRYVADTRLDTVSSERLLQLRNLYRHGEEVFEDVEKFKRWMRRPLTVLGGKAPIELLDTSMGFQLINDELLRIEYGVFA